MSSSPLRFLFFLFFYISILNALFIPSKSNVFYYLINNTRQNRSFNFLILPFSNQYNNCTTLRVYTITYNFSIKKEKRIKFYLLQQNLETITILNHVFFFLLIIVHFHNFLKLKISAKTDLKNSSENKTQVPKWHTR